MHGQAKEGLADLDNEGIRFTIRHGSPTYRVEVGPLTLGLQGRHDSTELDQHEGDYHEGCTHLNQEIRRDPPHPSGLVRSRKIRKIPVHLGGRCRQESVSGISGLGGAPKDLARQYLGVLSETFERGVMWPRGNCCPGFRRSLGWPRRNCQLGFWHSFR